MFNQFQFSIKLTSIWSRGFNINNSDYVLTILIDLLINDYSGFMSSVFVGCRFSPAKCEIS